MLDAAFQEIALAVSSAVGGPFHAATLNYPGTPVYDDGGSIITPGTPAQVSCHCQVDNVTEAMRASDDFNERDVRLIIIGPTALNAVPTVAVSAGPFSGQSYSIRSVARDPLGFAWECRGRGL
jgi:hypothetical protein